MRPNQLFFRWSMAFMAFHILLVLITPVFTVNSLLYPLRVDSTFVKQWLAQNNNSEDSAFLLHAIHPSQLGLKYQTVYFERNGQPRLQGWLSLDTTKKSAPLLLIIPDISEGKVCYLRDILEFNARGFHVCVMDMRAQGQSNGLNYDPGSGSAKDLVRIINKMSQLEVVEFISVLGIGTGAGICMKATQEQSINIASILLQNPPRSLEALFLEKALQGIGGVVYPFLPVVKRAYERTTGLDFHDHDFVEIMKKYNWPHLFIAAGYVTDGKMNDIRRLMESTGYSRNKIFLELQNTNTAPFHKYSKKYYDHLAGYILSSRQPAGSKTRTKKLVNNESRP